MVLNFENADLSVRNYVTAPCWTFCVGPTQATMRKAEQERNRMNMIQKEYTPQQSYNLQRVVSDTEMKQNRPKAVSFSKQKLIYLVEHRSELTSDEKSKTWYTSDECYSMAKKEGVGVLLQSKLDTNIQKAIDKSDPSRQPSKPEESTNRGLEQFQSLTHYKTFKNARKERIKAVLEAQKALRSYGVKDHSWAIHVACARESISSNLRAVTLGLSDQAEAFEIYRQG